MAYDLKTNLPLPVAQALTSKDWLGGALTQLDALTRPTAEDIKLNFAWVAPFVKFSPDKVPSGFFVTDCFLYCQPRNEGETKASLAAHEASNVKRLIGSLRSLWRSSVLFSV